MALRSDTPAQRIRRQRPKCAALAAPRAAQPCRRLPGSAQVDWRMHAQQAGRRARCNQARP
ncbi:MAG: hypothetical protein DWI67_03860 [Chloroflexi bacterium]|nr:MAG: hypothetical protein DWI61_00665 [Chloroflexota bacterium]RLT53426.1 MAG: hypothetical protein DWI67_03860 [Chloroflexota bacterium]